MRFATHVGLLLVQLSFTATAVVIPINETRIIGELHSLATHNDLTPPEVQRILYTPSDVSARAYLRSLMTSAGLSVHDDPLGNIFATWRGTSGSPGILTGSHFDAIPHSGMYDGTLGIMAALEAVRGLKAVDFVPERDITIIAFTSEEPTRFGLSCLGSRVLSGATQPSSLDELSDEAGVTFHDARKAAGYDGHVGETPLPDGAYAGFVELHIEQAPVLEDSKTDIGVVTAIAAPAAADAVFEGPGGHAGSLQMHLRHDAGLAGAELALAVESAAKGTGSADTVATTGRFEVFPGAVNSVPRRARLGMDVRDIDLTRRDAVLEEIRSAARAIAERRGVGHQFSVTNADAPATCSDDIVDVVAAAARELRLSSRRMVSRAYHDALFMARKIATGMIFVPCRGGVSHRPDEFVEAKDVKNGAAVLARVLMHLAGGEERDEL